MGITNLRYIKPLFRVVLPSGFPKIKKLSPVCCLLRYFMDREYSIFVIFDIQDIVAKNFSILLIVEW